MKHITIRLALITWMTVLISSYTWAQSPDTVFIRQDRNYDDTLIYDIDTVIFESGMRKHILFGTCVLLETSNQFNARVSYGLEFEKVTKSECSGSAEEKWVPDKINSVENTDSTLTIDMNITANCCHEFLCDVSVDSLGVLELIYNGYGTHCSCNCCFGLRYHFKKIPELMSSKIKAVRIRGMKEIYKLED